MNRDRLRKQLILHEGLRLKPYVDTVGKISVGVGRNLSDRGINHEEAQLLLENDIDDHWRDLIKTLPWVSELSEVRQRVVLDLAFNLGVPKLLGFRFTLRAIRDGRWEDAADGMLKSLWAAQVGERAKRLAKMMETGLDSEDF